MNKDITLIEVTEEEWLAAINKHHNINEHNDIVKEAGLTTKVHGEYMTAAIKAGWDEEVFNMISSMVRGERLRQLEKWGLQSYPDGTGIHYKPSAKMAKSNTELNAIKGKLTWKDVFMEEAWESLAETDPIKLIVELVQVAAVCFAWIDDIAARVSSEKTVEESVAEVTKDYRIG